jgi:hypothetical protein
MFFSDHPISFFTVYKPLNYSVQEKTTETSYFMMVVCSCCLYNVISL